MALDTKALGTVLKRGNNDGPPETFTTIAGVLALDPPELSKTFDETTKLNGDGAKQFTPTVVEVAEFTADLGYDSTDATHLVLFTDFENDVKRNWQIVFTDSGAEVYQFAAYVAKIKKLTQVDKVNRAQVTFRPSGNNTRS